MSNTVFTGPVKAGNVLDSDGTGNLAGVGGSSGTANVGFCVMAQSAVVTQVAAGVVTPIVIPAQSQILGIQFMPTTAGTGTIAISTTAGTSLVAAVAPAGTPYIFTSANPGAWDNVGNTDVQIKATASADGAGVGTLTVTYVQAINNAS